MDKKIEKNTPDTYVSLTDNQFEVSLYLFSFFQRYC